MAELVGFVEGASFDRLGPAVGLTNQQLRNILKVFLYGHRALRGRNMPAKNAALVAAHTGAETTFGTLGPNAATGNWFSLQLDDTGKRKRVKDALIARGVAMDSSARGNRATANAAVTASAVDNPVFKVDKGGTEDIDVPGMIEAQLDLVYGAPRDASVPSWAPDPNALFPSIGRALTQPGMTASAFGAVIGQAYAGAGTPEGARYSGVLTGTYALVKRALTWLPNQLHEVVSESTKAWARATLGGTP